ncbi:MAG TPA: hypothetical protein VJ508_17470, partial [Saprospiraceae bacterium]|nr:hypothetical protein [Saprospiraceae bacterium]
MSLLSVCELDQLAGNVRLLQVGKLIGTDMIGWTRTRMGFEFVIGAQLGYGKDLIDSAAAITTEDLILQSDLRTRA